MLSSSAEQCLTAISEFMVMFYWTCRLRGQGTKIIEDVLLVVVNRIYCIVVHLVFTTCSFQIELLIISVGKFSFLSLYEQSYCF